MFHRLFMTCQRVADRATEFDEGCCGLIDRLRLRLHLAICPSCDRYLKQLDATKKTCGLLRQGCSVNPETKAKLLEQFRLRNKS